MSMGSQDKLQVASEALDQVVTAAVSMSLRINWMRDGCTVIGEVFPRMPLFEKDIVATFREMNAQFEDVRQVFADGGAEVILGEPFIADEGSGVMYKQALNVEGDLGSIKEAAKELRLE